MNGNTPSNIWATKVPWQDRRNTHETKLLHKGQTKSVIQKHQVKNHRSSQHYLRLTKSLFVSRHSVGQYQINDRKWLYRWCNGLTNCIVYIRGTRRLGRYRKDLSCKWHSSMDTLHSLSSSTVHGHHLVLFVDQLLDHFLSSMSH